jgi:anion transporter
MNLSAKQVSGALVGGLFLLLAVLAPFPAHKALCLALFAVVFWTTEPVPLELSSLLVLLLLPALGLLSFEEGFAPFAGKTIWLIFAGMALSLGIAETGLGDRLAERALRYLGSRPFGLLLYLHLIGLLLAFLIPSGLVRVLLLMPFGMALAERVAQRHPDLDAAVLLSLLCSTYFGGGGILTGTVPNLVVAGQFERESGQTIFWSTWLWWMFPLIGLARTALSLLVIWCLLGRRLPPLSWTSPLSGDQAPLDLPQRRALLVLGTGMALWATDAWHQIAPAYVGLLGVLLLVLPGWGPLPFERLRSLNFPFFFYIAALFSLGTALQVSGFNQGFIDFVAGQVHLEAYGWFGRHLALTLMAVPLDFLMDIAAVAGVITPALMELGQAHGVEPLAAAMSTGMATTLVFLPYQAAPFMVAYSYRRFSLARLVLVQFSISLLSLLLICPLNVLYWHWLGLI